MQHNEITVSLPIAQRFGPDTALIFALIKADAPANGSAFRIDTITLAKLAGVSRRTIYRRVQQLADADLLHLTQYQKQTGRGRGAIAENFVSVPR